LSKLIDLPRFLARHGEGFFGVNRFSGFETRQHHRPVRLGNRQVDDELNRIIGEQFLNRTGAGNVPLLGFGAGGLEVDVGAGGDLEKRETRARRKVGIRNGAAADDADLSGGIHPEKLNAD